MHLAVPIEQIQAFLFVFFRVGGIVAFAPVLSSGAIPTIAKVAIALGTSVFIFPGVAGAVPAIPNDAILLTVALAGELLIGLVIGLLAQAMTSAVQFAGQIIGFHMGMRIANVFDPSAEVQVSLMGGFYNLLTILLLLSMNFHIIILGVVRQSYIEVAPMGLNLRLEAADVIIRFGANIFLFALQVVAPVLAALFFVEVIIAVLAKTAKQFNMLMLQFPLKILLGLIVLAVVIRSLPAGVQYMFTEVMKQIYLFLNLVG